MEHKILNSNSGNRSKESKVKMMNKNKYKTIQRFQIYMIIIMNQLIKNKFMTIKWMKA